MIFSVLGPQTHELCFFSKNIPDGHTEFDCGSPGDIDSTGIGGDLGKGTDIISQYFLSKPSLV
jgi:hypothetical protein